MRQAPALTFAAVLGLAIVASACGEDGATGGDMSVRASQPAALERTASRPAAGRCRSQLGGFLDILDALRNQLAVGLSYDGYRGLVRDARTVHAEIPAGRLGLACVAVVAAPAERALNVYIDAVNLWGECLATAGCEEASVEPELQHRWDDAADLLLSAERELRRM